MCGSARVGQRSSVMSQPTPRPISAHAQSVVLSAGIGSSRRKTIRRFIAEDFSRSALRYLPVSWATECDSITLCHERREHSRHAPVMERLPSMLPSMLQSQDVRLRGAEFLNNISRFPSHREFDCSDIDVQVAQLYFVHESNQISTDYHYLLIPPGEVSRSQI